MNIAEIRELANIMREAELTCLEVEEGSLRVKLEKGGQLMPLAAAPAALSAEASHSPISGAPAAELRHEDMGGRLIKSPTVGVFYASPSPDSNPYVQVGSQVKNGEVLCIIEAMKLMNEITADCDGEIAEVLVGNGQVVEFGQPLFRIK